MAIQRSPVPSITPVVGFIIVTNILVYALQTRSDFPVGYWFALWPLHVVDG
jgi:hypothetical protein